jgi:hypothetical protein
MKHLISAKFSYGGVSDYPGSSFEGKYSFKSESENPSEAVMEFVDWVISKGAGVTAAISLNNIASEVDPDGEIEYLLDQFLSFRLSAKPEITAVVMQDLHRSGAYKLAHSVITGNARPEVITQFMALVRSCIENENPGPLLTEQVSDYLT